jgi:predicted CoA-binding protein
VPVNPNTPELEGLPCYPHVQAIRPAVDGALLLTSREGTYHALIDCEEAGIRRVWLYGLNGPKEVSVGAMEFCASHGISVVPGYCPLMFLPERGIVHRLHGAFMKLTGSYPR